MNYGVGIDKPEQPETTITNCTEQMVILYGDSGSPIARFEPNGGKRITRAFVRMPDLWNYVVGRDRNAPVRPEDGKLLLVSRSTVVEMQAMGLDTSRLVTISDGAVKDETGVHCWWFEL